MNNCSRYSSYNGNLLSRNNTNPSTNNCVNQVLNTPQNQVLNASQNQTLNNSNLDLNTIQDQVLNTSQSQVANISQNQISGCNNLNSTTDNNCVNENLLDSLCNCVGRKCTCEFATERGIESKNGILDSVGNNFIVLRALNNNNKIMYCNTHNLLFVTIS